MLFQYVRNADLGPLYDALDAIGLATPNIGTLADMICCPGLDYCSLANATSIPVAKEIHERFADLDDIYDLGQVDIKMSGCINACGHHHMGHIGILGISKRGEEFYQIAVGGNVGELAVTDARTAEIIGPAVSREEVVNTIERLLDCYRDQRTGTESFIETLDRVGLTPFQERAYV